MSIVSIVLICDGTSDTCIQDIIQWVVDSQFPDRIFRIQAAREVIPAHAPLETRIRRTHKLYEPNIIVCHRDAENQVLGQRILEIANAAGIASVAARIVPAVPVRMIESWLLVNEGAIRRAANNRNGTNPLTLPSHSRIENETHPKLILMTALRTASGLPPQRLKRFDAHQARSRITGFMDTFAELRQQNGFLIFEQELVAAVNQIVA